MRGIPRLCCRADRGQWGQPLAAFVPIGFAINPRLWQQKGPRASGLTMAVAVE